MAKHLMRPIPGFEGLYSITEDGRIYSHGRIARGGFMKERTFWPQWIQTHENPETQREMVCLYDINGRRFAYRVYRLVATVWVPNPDNKKTVNHIDGNKKNNHASNLEWMNMDEQYKHAKENGLYEKGRYD